MRYIVLFDPHVPGHNQYFIDAILNYIYINRNSIHGLIWGGDFLDLEQISSYSIGMKFLNTLGEEYEIGNKILDLFDSALGKKKEKYYLYGNHETRLRRRTESHEWSKVADVIMSIKDGLKLSQRSYKVLEEYPNEELRIVNFLVFHGVYTNKYSAYKHLDMYQENMVFGHTHRINSFYSRNCYVLNGGWLGDPNHDRFKWMPSAQRALWKNAIVTLDVFEGISYPQLHLWNKENKKLVVESKWYG